MGLNDGYDNKWNQILLMEPLPSVNKAYSMVLCVEKQREVHNLFRNQNDNAVMMVKNESINKETGRSTFVKHVHKEEIILSFRIKIK